MKAYIFCNCNGLNGFNIFIEAETQEQAIKEFNSETSDYCYDNIREIEFNDIHWDWHEGQIICKPFNDTFNDTFNVINNKFVNISN